MTSPTIPVAPIRAKRIARLEALVLQQKYVFMKGLVAVLAALCAQGVSAQWGPWTQWWSAGLGAWQGDTAAFAVAESDWLLLVAPAAATYALWREGLGSRPARFSASLQMNFNPSSVNYAFWEVWDSSGMASPSPFLRGYT